MRCKGIVRGNKVLLEEEVRLPDGVHVTITVEEGQMEEQISPEELEPRRNLVAQMKAFWKRLEGRHIDLGDLVIKGREEP